MPKRTYTSDAGEDRSISTKGITFTLDEVEFECDGVFDDNDMVDLAADLMDSDESWVDPRALGAVGQVFRTIMGEDTYRAFRRHRRAHRTRPEVLSQIMLGLIEDITQRDPTRLSASPPGPAPAQAARSSPPASPSPASPARRRKAEVAARSATTRSKMAAVDPGGVIPPDWAGAGDVITAPAAPAEPAEEEETPTRRTVNLGDQARTRVEPMWPQPAQAG